MFANFLIPALVSNNVAGLGNLAGFINRPETVINKIEKETLVVPEADYFGDDLKKNNLRLVFIQSFSQNKILRFGSGIVLTQDGIIATLNSVVPPDAEFYQVWLDDMPQKAKVAYRDLRNNIALVKVESSNLSVVELSGVMPRLASSLLFIGKIVNFNKTEQIVEPVIVTSAQDGNFLFKADYSESLFGAALIDKDGKVLGIANFKNRIPVLIKSDRIKEVLEEYFEVSGF